MADPGDVRGILRPLRQLFLLVVCGMNAGSDADDIAAKGAAFAPISASTGARASAARETAARETAARS